MLKFITVEGMDGSGKTTIVTYLKECLEKKGFEVITTREPGGSIAGEKIRDLLLYEDIDIKTEVLLFAASRREHIKNKISPELEKGKIVICDRFLDSSVAYQAYGRGLEESDIMMINNYILDGIIPDLTFYLDVDVNIGLSRTKYRDNNNKLDNQSIQFYTKVKNGYESIANNNTKRVIKINANYDIQKVKDRILIELERYL